MSLGSKIFIPNRCLGYVSNHIPLQVRYIKNRKENLIVTCVGKSFHTYGVSHFGLLSVSGLHPSDITCMSSDAYHIYTACGTTIYAWRRGTELKHTYNKHSCAVHILLPFAAHLISIDVENKLYIWDIKEETIFLELQFSVDDFQITTILHPSTYINKVLLGSEQGSLQLWNINTAKLIYSFKGWNSPVTCLEQAPALDVVAVGLQNGKIMLHNLKYDETIMDFTQDWGTVTSISFRTDNHPIMATGSVTGHIVFWNLEERRVASQLLNAHGNAVAGMICLPNEPLVVTSSCDNTLKLWIFDMTDGGARLLRIREGHSAPPSFIRFHGSNGHNILSAASDSTLRIFNTQTEQFNKSLGKASYNRKASKKRGRGNYDPLIMPPITQFTSEVTREKEWDNIAAIHSGLSIITSWSYDKLKMGDLKLQPERLHKKKNLSKSSVSATSICLTHCGNFVLVGYTDGFIDRFNIQSGLWRDSYGTPNAHEGCVRGITTDSLNQITISGGSDAKIQFWKFKNKGSMAVSVLSLSEPVSFFRTHQESSMLAVALEDFTVLIVDTDTRAIVRQFDGHTAQVTDATFSIDSRWLITAAIDCTVRVWDVPSSQLVDQFKTESACTSLSMSPTGEALATTHVNYLGIFLWSNRTLYSKVSLKALSPTDEPALISLPEVSTFTEVLKAEEVDSDEFISPEQISLELVTISGLSSSRWLNLLDINIIKKKNKPIAPPTAPKAAPFFLPTVASLEFKFDLTHQNDNAASKFLVPESLLSLSPFGKILNTTATTDDFNPVIEKLKTMGPSLIELEIKSLHPQDGGSITVMLQFLKLIEFMLKSNQNFELAHAYLGVFLKEHARFIASEEILREYLKNVKICLSSTWNRIQKKLFYNLCVVENLKTM
ncbi:hypothetical protein PPYR_04500 [Photinus pyralis]|uniref:Uncharacterized protein n=1 Tax=Photinus pyralis TaxID=7054 RepID=A0A1Y1JXJ9_PHOPY|nr:WD repeat-containing protein 36 [Photinus pyralis]KAB0802314.1 hypothetical protein PPYR_04500 [Photinus pyralis]